MIFLNLPLNCSYTCKTDSTNWTDLMTNWFQLNVFVRKNSYMMFRENNWHIMKLDHENQMQYKYNHVPWTHESFQRNNHGGSPQ